MPTSSFDPRGIMRTAATATAAGTKTPLNSATETFDAVLGNFSFDAIAGRRYRVVLEGASWQPSVANLIAELRIHMKQGSTTPGTGDTIVAASNPLLTSTDVRVSPEYDLKNTFTVSTSGQYTLAVSTQNILASGQITPVSAGGLQRSLYVEDIGVF